MLFVDVTVTVYSLYKKLCVLPIADCGFDVPFDVVFD